jgi:cell wall-associated NlpC family hydrolase
LYPEGSAIVKYALQFLGMDYVWGGASPATGFDCSGMMYYVYGQFGYDICRTASYQYKYNGVSVNSIDDLQPGDLVFFHHTGETSVAHVGMYIGEGVFIHAASSKSGIKISSLYSNYYNSNYMGAKRILGH